MNNKIEWGLKPMELKCSMKVLKTMLLGACVFLAVSGLFNETCAGDSRLLMATTTSTDNTGLLDYLAPRFEADTGIELQWVAVGTGKALELGKNCDVDILMVHAPAAEKQYIKDGYGILRSQIMYNDFVLIGPDSDPADIEGKTVSEALKVIKLKKSTFVSRGDESGTHKAEKSLWAGAGIAVPDKETWYIQTGQGMLSSINIAAQMGGYTFTDRGTYIKYESNLNKKPPLVVLVEGDKVLRNQYSVIKLNLGRCRNEREESEIQARADKFIEWITSSKAQELIGNFRLLGKPLFIPNAGS
jgi:tungstate transport system substrate-binding protein